MNTITILHPAIPPLAGVAAAAARLVLRGKKLRINNRVAAQRHIQTFPVKRLSIY
jgi:hypothetical protein